MKISAGEMKQTRIVKMSKGVVAAALTIDNKFRAAYGEPKLHPASKRLYLPSSPYRCALITLTYRQDATWDKGHISELIKHYREWFKRNGNGETFHYVWVMELTEIGRPHYHIVAWFPRGIKPPLPDKQGWWRHGMTQAKFATSPVGYIAKYASKAETKSGTHLPKGGRLWGYGGLRMDERAPVAYALAPRWLKGLVHHESQVVKRTYQRVEKTIRYACGFVHEHVIRRSGWFVKTGYGQGNWFFSPYECEGFTDNGIVLSHRGHIEMLTNEGDSFYIGHKA